MQGVVNRIPRNLTLLQVTPELETGDAEQPTLDINRAVVRIGGRSLVASRGGRMAEPLRAAGGRLFELPMQTGNPLGAIGNTGRLLDIIQREKVSLVHARSRAPVLSALWAARAAKIPFVATYHGIHRAGNPLRRWYNSAMTQGSLVIADSEYSRAHLLREHALNPNRVVTIPRGVDLARFDLKAVSEGRLAALRQAWRLPLDDRRLKIALCGRLSPTGGHLTIIEAMARLKAWGRDDIVVVIAGDHQGHGRRIDLVALALIELAHGEVERALGQFDLGQLIVQAEQAQVGAVGDAQRAAAQLQFGTATLAGGKTVTGRQRAVDVGVAPVGRAGWQEAQVAGHIRQPCHPARWIGAVVVDSLRLGQSDGHAQQHDRQRSPAATHGSKDFGKHMHTMFPLG